MALGASVHKIDLDVSDTDRHYYAQHKLTVARHPSETLDRMMVRVLAFALNAGPDLAFGRGVSTADEPDLWEVDPTGAIIHWIDVGQPAFERLKKARSRSINQTVYSFGRGRDVWWREQGDRFGSLDSLRVLHLSDEDVAALASVADKTLTLSACISEGSVYLSAGERTVTVNPYSSE